MANNKVQLADGTTLIDLTSTTATADKILQGYGAFGADGAWIDGTAVAGSGSAITITDTLDANGGTIREISAVSLEGDTVSPSTLLSGTTAHNALGQSITGTYEALPCPVFRVLNDSEGHEISITCNKTFNECRDMLTDDSYMCLSAIVVESGQTVDDAPDVWDHAYCGGRYNGTANPAYVRYYSTNNRGVPVYQLTYYSDGTITNTSENLDPLMELSVTQNGTYSALPYNVYGTVNVNVTTGSEFIIEIVQDQTDSTLYVPNCTFADYSAAVTAGKTIIVTTNLQDVSCKANITTSSLLEYYVYTLEVDPNTFESSVFCRWFDFTSSGVTKVVVDPFYDTTGATATASEVASGSTFFTSTGKVTGTAIRRSSSDLTDSGATVTVPSGYYASQATKSVASGSVTAPSTISGTSATVSTGTNTLTLTKTVSVTPNVTTAGYISSGTAGNSSVSLQASVTTQAAQTIHPSTSNQTISSGRYLTGNQTINAVTTTNLTAENIKSGVTVQIGDSSDSDCVTSVTGTYTGGGSSKNVQAYLGYASRTANSYGATNVTLKVAKTGTYKISWCAWRGSSSGTMGTNLHIGSTTGTNQQTWTGTYGQCITLENQNLTADTTLTLYATSGNNSRTIYVGNLIIEEQ